MKYAIAALTSLLLFASLATADNVGNCGWGSKLFDGQRGIAPQVLAVTTNGTSGNQTFGITFGTSGCSQDGVVKSSWRTAAFIDSNMNKFARDVSRGQGESLDSVAALLGVQENDRNLFALVLQENFSAIFASQETSSADVLASMKQVLDANTKLSQYAANI